MNEGVKVMKTNILVNNSIMKNVIKYLCAVLMIICTSASAWGAKVLSFDFSDKSADELSEWPTSDGGSATTKTYELNNEYTFALGANVYLSTYNSADYLMLKYTTSLGVPAISGYKLTKVEITNSGSCSTSTKVGISSSSSSASYVTGGSTQTYSTKSTTYTYNLSGTSANTVYYIYVTTANCQIVNLMLTYTATSTYTVTFDAGTGTCASSSLPEASVGAGVTLPTATPSSDCSSDYEFMGWSPEEIDETDEEPTMYFAGNQFYPESNCTLYAVYVANKAPTTYYEIISNRAQLKSGENYIIEAYSGGNDYAIKAAVKNSNYIDCKDITSAISSTTYHEDTPDGDIVWTITKDNETTVSLYNSTTSKYLWINSSSPNYLGLNASKQTFTLEDEDHGEGYVGTFAFYAQSRYVYFNSSYTNFDRQTSGSDWNIFVYKRTYSGTFNTNPVCYSDYKFSCAELELDEPDNSATENVVSNVVYMTSTAGQKVRSLAHFHVHGDGLTPNQEVKFTAGSTALDALYTFKKADGTAVMTNASGEVDDDVYVYYQPTETSDGRDNVTSVKAYVERKGDGSGKPKAVINDERPINGRHLPEQFIIAAKVGDYWYALPADMLASSAHGGYSFTPNNASAPTQATVAPATAIYNLYGFAAAGTYDRGFVRFAGDLNDKALWSNKSNASIGISNKAAIGGGSAKGEQYEWRLTNTGADTYNLWNHAAYLTGRNLGIQKTDKKWNMYTDGSGVVKELRILPVVSISAYIELLGEDWEESAFTYTKVSGEIPAHDHIQVTYNGDTYTATESGTTVTITDADFASDGGFASAPGTQLTLEWCDEDGNVLAQGSLFTPIFITSNTVNLSDYDADVLKTTDVFITNGAKLTVNEDVTVHDVTVNAGSTLVVDDNSSEGKTLEMKNGKLTLRGGWTTIGGTPKYDMPRVYIDPLSTLKKSNTTINLYMDIFKSEDGKHYYPFAVPFAAAVNEIDYVDPTLATASEYGKHYVIKRYNGAKRAENGTGDNWEVVPAGSILKPGEGYIITAVAVGDKAQLVVPMKNVTNDWLKLGEQATVSDSTKNVIKVTAHTGTATAGGGANNRHKGWNMVGVPFMSCYTSGTDMYSGVGSADLMSGRMELSGDVSDPYAWETSDVVYVSVPTHDFSEYIQTDITTAQLVPGWSFFIQVGTTGNLTFLTTKQAESSSTPLYAPQRETSPIVKTGIVLTGGEKSDKTTLIISDRYSTEYEIGADLEKMFGNGYTLATYSITGGMQLAFNAMSTEDVKQVIPVGVRLPEDGEYTFSLNSQYADADIERLDLIDYETGEVTNLMMSDYRFTATRSQNNDRFALNVVPMVKMPTGVEDSDVRSQYSYPEGTIISDVRKIILDDKMFIIRDGLLYDATGKRVKEINK